MEPENKILGSMRFISYYKGTDNFPDSIIYYNDSGSRFGEADIGTLSGTNKMTYKGLQKNIRKLKTPKIDTWKNQYPDKDYNIHLEFPEFTCICPKTGLPDFATIIIDYTPDKDCIELKSLKEYFIVYRNLGILHEHVVNKVLEDLVAACQPRSAKVVGEFNIRGGIKTTVVAEYTKGG